MKTAISISDALFIRAEKTARKLGITRSKLYNTALEKYLQTYSEKEITEQLDSVYSVNDSSIDKKILDMQNRTIIKNKDEW